MNEKKQFLFAHLASHFPIQQKEKLACVVVMNFTPTGMYSYAAMLE